VIGISSQLNASFRAVVFACHSTPTRAQSTADRGLIRAVEVKGLSKDRSIS
jgi:hypothetical protein